MPGSKVFAEAKSASSCFVENILHYHKSLNNINEKTVWTFAEAAAADEFELCNVGKSFTCMDTQSTITRCAFLSAHTHKTPSEATSKDSPKDTQKMYAQCSMKWRAVDIQVVFHSIKLNCSQMCLFYIRMRFDFLWVLTAYVPFCSFKSDNLCGQSGKSWHGKKMRNIWCVRFVLLKHLIDIRLVITSRNYAFSMHYTYSEWFELSFELRMI